MARYTEIIDMATQLEEAGIVPIILKNLTRDENGKKTATFENRIKWRESPSLRSQLKILPKPKALAIRTGEESNITCIDIDDMDKLIEVDEKFNLLAHAKIIVKTNKGVHLYYDFTEELTQTQQAKLKIDIRSDGGLLFFPPTDGYEFIEHEGDGIVPKKFIKWFNENKSSVGVTETVSRPSNKLKHNQSNITELATNYDAILKKLNVSIGLVDGRKSATISLFQKLWNRGYDEETADDIVVYWNDFNNPPLPINDKLHSLNHCKESAKKYWLAIDGNSFEKCTKTLHKKEFTEEETKSDKPKNKEQKTIEFTEDDLFKPWNILEAVGYNAFKLLNGRYIIRTISGIDDIINVFSTEKDFKAYLNGNVANKYKLQILKIDKKGNPYYEKINFNKVDWSYLTNVRVFFAPERKDITWNYNGEKYINVYAPKPMLHLKPTEHKPLNPLLKKFFMNLVGDNEDYFNWFMNWLASNYQFKTKSEKSVIFISASGVGKNLLFKLLRKIYSDDYIHMSASTKLLNNDFNSELKDKLYYFMDEFKIEDKNEMEYEKLKAYTAQNDTFSLTEKGKETTMYPLTANFIFYSNREKPLRISEGFGDRRFNVFRPASVLKKVDWWKEYEDEDGLSSHDQILEMAGEFAEFLASYKVDKALRNKDLHTEAWVNLIELSQTDETLFVTRLLKGEWKWFEDSGVLDMVNETGFTYKSILKKAYLEGKIQFKNLTEIFEAMYGHHFIRKEVKEVQNFKPMAIRFKFGNSGTFIKEGLKLPVIDIDATFTETDVEDEDTTETKQEKQKETEKEIDLKKSIRKSKTGNGLKDAIRKGVMR